MKKNRALCAFHLRGKRQKFVVFKPSLLRFSVLSAYNAKRQHLLDQQACMELDIAFINGVCFRNTTNSCFYEGYEDRRQASS